MNKYHRSAIVILIFASLNFGLCEGVHFVTDSFVFFKSEFSNSVEIKDRSGSIFLTKKEAERNILDLIQRLDPSEIIPIHEGFSQDKQSFYEIIQFVSAKGNYRLFYYCEKIEGEYLITKIRVHKS